VNFLPSCANEARRLGRDFYQTAAPCKHGHVAPRRTKNNVCLECEREKGRARVRTRASTREKVAAPKVQAVQPAPAPVVAVAPKVRKKRVRPARAPVVETLKPGDESPTCSCEKCKAPVVVPAHEPQPEPQSIEERTRWIDPGLPVNHALIDAMLDRIFLNHGNRLGREQNQAAAA
jgi:hypothetical protein